MGIPVMILGESGSGKTYSLRNLDKTKTALIQITKKRLPFKEEGWAKVVSNNYAQVAAMVTAGVSKGREIIVIDDFQYLMAYEFVARGSEVGYTKYSELAANVVNLLTVLQNTPDNVRCYLTWHSETDEHKFVRAKTIGKMLNEKITVEGLFTIILRSYRDKLQSKYFFSTQSNGDDVCKSPPGMFESEQIENDLQKVDEAICKFYNIGEQGNAIQS